VDDSDYLIFSIFNDNDLNLLLDFKNSNKGFGDKKTIIRFPDGMLKLLEATLGKLYWFSFGGYTAMFINQDLKAPA